ncbi:MAG: alpha-L-arabinofuranosidase, partial [Chloroflexi bacterium]|nr:alpha-L-arabinofuranosidase [Chloroflexota bacterium]
NAYSWLACETGDEERNTDDGCYWPWAARPTDFLNFVRDTGQEAMWTVSINGTAKEAAALVAFFNGSVDDTTQIGVDLRGYDWKTVGHWASLRAAHGNSDPLPIKLWEVGNEVYGGNSESGGAECADWGWEDVWTCDGTEYMLGNGSGSDRHEGYLEFREAMRAVDPTIMVGAVGVAYPDDWSDWGNEVIREGGENLDFYVIHYYAYDKQPSSADEILARPQQIWRDTLDATNAAFDKYAGGRRAPIAVTEYNLVAFQDLDNDQLMTRAANALFVADMIGQMAKNGVTMANQWDLANGQAENGTDYGLIAIDTGARAPQYYAMLLWTRFGNEMLPLDSPLSDMTTLSVYAGRSEDGTLSILAINKTGEPLDVQFLLSGASGSFSVSADVFAAKTLEATEGMFNDNASPADDLSDAPSMDLGLIDGSLDYTVEPFSITLIRLAPNP